MNIEKYRGRGLSKYRTYNYVENFLEVRSAEDIRTSLDFIKSTGGKIFVLGGGSNVFLSRSKIHTLIIKNGIPNTIIPLGGDEFDVTSSVGMLQLLQRMYSEGRDAPYYLASAPCEIGGAIAMNAGSGPKDGLSISDFIVSIRYVNSDGEVITKPKSELNFSYRNSDFLGNGFNFILSAKFRFPKREFSENPIEARMKWARENQDLTAPNCGSLCGKYDAKILRLVRAITSPLPAGLSKKKLNWAYNKAESPIYLRIVLYLIKILHKLLRKDLKFEIRIID